MRRAGAAGQLDDSPAPPDAALVAGLAGEPTSSGAHPWATQLAPAVKTDCRRQKSMVARKPASSRVVAVKPKHA